MVFLRSTFLEHWLLTLALFVPFWLGCYGYAIYFMWQALAPIARTKFSFYITDVWVAMLCLAPTLALVAETVRFGVANRERELAVLVILAFSQVLGIVLGRIFSFPRDGEKMPRRADQAIWVVAGAFLFGVVGLVAIVIAFILLTLPVLVIISCPPAGIWVLAFFYLAYRRWSKAKSKLK